MPLTDSQPKPIAFVVKELARRFGRGEDSALAALFDATASRLLRYAESITRNRAEDVLQLSMIRVAESPHRLALADHPWAYFLRIVRNESLKLIGRRKPACTLENTHELACLDDALLERLEFRQKVHEALNRLPSEQAEVVVLKIWEEMTFLEISVVLEESANTAASRYRYAMAKLSRLLQPYANEVSCG